MWWNIFNWKKNRAYQLNLEKQLLENTVQQDTIHGSNLICPDCTGNMSVTFVDDIEIDICKSCLGVWFDKTEAQAIIKKYNHDDSTSLEGVNKNDLAPFPSEFAHLLSKWFLHNPQV